MSNHLRTKGLSNNIRDQSTLTYGDDNVTMNNRIMQKYLSYTEICILIFLDNEKYKRVMLGKCSEFNLKYLFAIY